MRKVFLAIALLCSVLTASAQDDMKTFVDNLMAKMTLKEKIGQLNLLPGGDITTGQAMNSPLGALAAKGELGAILNVKGQDKIRELQEIAVKKSRLGIPMIFGQDVIHGYETVFPIPLAQACSWNLAAIENGARIAAKEATAQGISWVYSPMVDVSIDPRWGRIAESAGEDPLLNGLVGAALIRGYQGNYGPENAMACVKHYALYGAAEAGRDYNTTDMSRIRMYNQYFLPFKMAVEAGAGSFMSSFNIVDGIPATGNKWLLTEVLRNQWKFDGFLATDYGAINEMSVHGIGEQDVCVAQALKAGTDMDMCSGAYTNQLEKCLNNGTVTIADIDLACRRVLEAKYKLGLFKDPYRFCDKKRATKDMYTAESRLAARNLAAETFVLLKNQHNLLPLKKEGKIALIGPLGDTRNNLPGMWSTGDKPEKYTTLKEAMQKVLKGKATVTYAQGSNIYRDAQTQKAASFGREITRVDDSQAKAEALRIARESDVIIAALGEMAEMSGESSSRSDLHLPDVQMELLQALVATGKPVVLLNYSGRPTILTWENENVNSILNVWYGGSETGDAICDVLFGDKVPSGKLTTTFPKSMGQIPMYYNHLNTGRPVPDGAQEFRKYQSNYLDIRNDELYPFGYGLSYTTFSYGDIALSANSMSQTGTVKATVTVTNTGKYDVDEVVQLYIRDRFASISRPVKELKGFERIRLKAGESKTVSFNITPDMLKFYNSVLQFVLEPGDFDIMIGPHSKNLKTAKLTVI